MQIKDLIKISGDTSSFNTESIIIPDLSIGNIGTFKNVIFDFMDFAEESENKGKRIYLSRDILFYYSGTHLGEDSYGFGESYLGQALEKHLDNAIFKSVGKHLKSYIRIYDNKKHIEKVFLPLECEVFNNCFESKDESLKYSGWRNLKDPKSRIKKVISSNYKEDWLCANRGDSNKSYCSVAWNGCSTQHLETYCGVGIAIAFCI